MASVFFRGSKSSPRWFARVKVGGVWRARRVRQQTKRDALAVARAIEAREERRTLGLEAPEHASLKIGDMMERWQAGLANRAARNDQYRIAAHLVPHFGAFRVSELSVGPVMLWLDALATAGNMKASSQRGLLALLSRFCSWGVDRGFLTSNPCKAIPAGRRPRGQQSGAEVPWLSDDAVVIQIVERLPEPFSFIFLLANRCGCRTGEAAGLRMEDLAGMSAGSIRIARSYLGWTKESKDGPKTKHVPAPSDLPALLAPWLERRRAEGAGDADLVFPARDGRFPYGKDEIGYQWRKVRDALGLPRDLTFHRAGRHSFASRGLAAGASIDEISQALGHSSVALTQARYLHWQRRQFSSALTSPLRVPAAPEARIIPIAAARTAPARGTRAAAVAASTASATRQRRAAR